MGTRRPLEEGRNGWDPDKTRDALMRAIFGPDYNPSEARPVPEEEYAKGVPHGPVMLSLANLLFTYWCTEQDGHPLRQMLLTTRSV